MPEADQASPDRPGAARRGSKPTIGGRSEARERAVHLLYEAEIKAVDPAEVLASQVVTPGAFTMELIDGVAAHREELDGLIEQYARDWTIKRMPLMDVVVLRVAVFELVHRGDVPTAAVLSEAVELAARYGTDDSSRFVNGLLGAAARELRPS